jgi:MerR family transcriptional regulator, copper efflux regulator
MQVADATGTVAGELLTIGAAARRAGLTRKAVRLYEARGLLPPVERTKAGYRLFSEHDVQALRFIGQARAVGLGLGEIGTIMALRRAGIPPSKDVIALLEGRLAVIQRQVLELQGRRHTLADVLGAVTSRAHRGDEARLCRVLDTGAADALAAE